MIRRIGAVFVGLMLALSPAAFPCSAFLISAPNETFVGRNLDWEYGHGLVIVNPRGLEKRALIGPPNNPARWISKYGSVTFNQIGRELPYGGINEKGLDVELLWLDSARFPDPNGRPALNEAQWVQYQLDEFSSVREIVASLKKINVVSRIAPVHYFACDASGDCAAVELIAGKFSVHRGKALPIPALTNDTYSDSLRYATRFASSKNISDLPSGTKSLDRFARLAHSLASNNGFPASFVQDAFAKLAGVSSPKSDDDDGETQWSVVADLKRKIVYFKTLESATERSVDLSRIDFSCDKTAKVIDVNVQAAGDVAPKFTDYSTGLNAVFVNKSLSTGFAHLPADAIQMIARYPDSLVCKK